ncbi:hypothetical protein ACLOJK_021862 [Asimina triloba]
MCNSVKWSKVDGSPCFFYGDKRSVKTLEESRIRFGGRCAHSGIQLLGLGGPFPESDSGFFGTFDGYGDDSGCCSPKAFTHRQNLWQSCFSPFLSNKVWTWGSAVDEIVLMAGVVQKFFIASIFMWIAPTAILLKKRVEEMTLPIHEWLGQAKIDMLKEMAILVEL